MELVEYTKINKDGKSIVKKHYPKLYGRNRKQEKRDDAEARQAERDKLTLEQKVAHSVLGSKEHKKLLSQIEKGKA